MTELTIKRLYRIWKKGGVGLGGLSAMRREMLRKKIEDRGRFQSERDLSNLIPTFQKYQKYGEPLRDLIYFWMVLLFLLWAYFTIMKGFAGIFADVYLIGTALQIIVFSSLIFLFSMIYLGLTLRKCSLDRPNKITTSKKLRGTVSIWSIILLIIMTAVCTIIENTGGFNLPFLK
ncbi:MAG: hypothetical protein ACTSO2_05750 [Promethearchaeota archaeon]